MSDPDIGRVVSLEAAKRLSGLIGDAVSKGATLGGGGGVPTAFYDLFRVESGKIVEHWDTISEIPTEMADDSGKF